MPIDDVLEVDRTPDARRVLDEVTSALRDAPSVSKACHRVVGVLGDRTSALVAALLRVHDHLRNVAASGSWSVFSAAGLDDGVIGRVYRTGRTAVVTDIDGEDGYIPLGPVASVEICVPIRDSTGSPIGALNLESTEPLDIDTWRPLLEEIGVRLGARVGELGGAPTESRTEQLLRHALAMTSARTLGELLGRALVAAREVADLSTPLVLLPSPDGARAYWDRTQPTALGKRVAELDPKVLAALAKRGERFGSSYTLGDPENLDAAGFEALTEIGVKTMITVPGGPTLDPDIGTQSAGGVLLVVDEEVSRPDAGTVNLLELLAAQAWTAVERLQTLAALRERAISDPLTGLRHNGPFGERLAGAPPERTALLAVDIDRFKDINDTYGHQEGDRALVDLAQALRQALRAQDELYRIGGDEFAAILEISRPEEAVRIAERLVQAARRVGRSVSVGVAVRLPDESGKETLRRADTALYEAKRTGRNGVRVAYPLRTAVDAA